MFTDKKRDKKKTFPRLLTVFGYYPSENFVALTRAESNSSVAICVFAILYAVLSIYFIVTDNLAAQVATFVLDLLSLFQVILSTYQKSIHHIELDQKHIRKTENNNSLPKYGSNILSSPNRTAYEIKYKYMVFILIVSGVVSSLCFLFNFLYLRNEQVGISVAESVLLVTVDTIILFIVVSDVLLEQYAFQHGAQANKFN